MKMAQHQDCHNTTGQLFTVTSVESLLELHPSPHLHLVDDLHDATLTGNDEGLLSGPLLSSALELHQKYLPWAEQDLTTPPVELLLSHLNYLVGAARVVADDVEEDKSPEDITS